MAAGNCRVPPVFSEKDSYESWKNEVEMWMLVCDLDKKSQAPLVALSLTGRARSSALGIDAARLNTDNGMKVLLEKLDSIYLKEEKDRQYEAYTEFDKIQRKEGASMEDHIVEFERRYHRLCKHNIELPDAVLSFKLLDTAGLSVRDRQLTLTACPNVLYATMKSALKRVFGDSNVPPQGDAVDSKRIRLETVHEPVTHPYKLELSLPSLPLKNPATPVKLQFHSSVVPNHIHPKLTQKSNSLYQCPICLRQGEYHKLVPHLQVHRKNTVSHAGFAIYKCNAGCVSSGHYHCFCGKCYVRRDNFLHHLETCQVMVGSSVPLVVTRLSTPPAALTPSAPTALKSPSAPSAVTILSASPAPKSPPAPHAPKSPSAPTAVTCSSPSPTLTDSALTSSDAKISPSLTISSSREKKIPCCLCNLKFYKKNMDAHFERQHPDTVLDMKIFNCLPPLSPEEATALN